jgi:hypothetical protein
MLANPTDNHADALRQITAEQLRWLGIRRTVYLKAVKFDGEHILMMIYGADGTFLEAVDDIETAMEQAAERGFSFAGVH